MAFAALNLENRNNIQKQAPVGFSWTTFFFGFFPALFRGDWKWGMIIGIAAFVTFGLSSFIFAFFYNRLYIQDLLNNGFKVKNYSGNKALIEQKTQIKLRR